jgi:hypothetical protein
VESNHTARVGRQAMATAGIEPPTTWCSRTPATTLHNRTLEMCAPRSQRPITEQCPAYNAHRRHACQGTSSDARGDALWDLVSIVGESEPRGKGGNHRSPFDGDRLVCGLQCQQQQPPTCATSCADSALSFGGAALIPCSPGLCAASSR